MLTRKPAMLSSFSFILSNDSIAANLSSAEEAKMFSRTARFEGYQNVFSLNVTNHAVRNVMVFYNIPNNANPCTC